MAGLLEARVRFGFTALAVCAVLGSGPARAQAPPEACRRATEQYQAGQADAAVAAFRECIALVPSNPGLLSDYGAALSLSGAYDQAIEQYERALALSPGHPVIRRNIALAYYKSGRLAEAATTLTDLHAGDRDNVQVALLLSDCLVQLGEPRKAVDLLAPFEPSQGGDRAFAYIFGLALMDDGQLERAERVIDPLLRNPESADAQLLLGATALARKDYPSAVSALGRAVALDPSLPTGHSLYGQALLATGDPDGALAAFRQELASNPNDYEANLRCGQILLQRRQYDDARARLEKALVVRSSSSEARYELGVVQAATGRIDEARDAFEHVLRDAPQFAAAHAALASVYARIGRAGDAATERQSAGADGTTEDDSLLTVGAIAPEFSLPRAGAPGEVALVSLRRTRPVVLIFGSLSCPKFRFDASALQRIYDSYNDRLAFLMVYVHEAHGDDSWRSTINERERIAVPPVRTLGDKQHNAALCLRRLALRFPAVVDAMDRTVETAYGAWPSAVYVVGTDGTVRWRSRLGEQEFSADRMREALDGVAR